MMNREEYYKYLTNEATGSEKEEFYKKLRENSDLERDFVNVLRLWDLASISKTFSPSKRKEQLFEILWRKIHNRHNKGRKLIYSIIPYAAIFILLIAFSFFAYYLGYHNSGRQNGSYTTISCAAGDKSSVLLPDSTKVCLNSGSKLVFKNNFGNRKREVHLMGEAFFEVKQNKKNPFVVNANDIEVEVLGTRFNVKAYPEDAKITSTLLEGGLYVSSDSQSASLSPGQKVIFNKNTRKMDLIVLEDTDPDTEWKDGRLIFRNQSLADLEHMLERWFDVDIEFADELVKTRRFTGILERESILEAVSYFGKSDYVEYRIDRNEITFYSEN